MGWCKWEGAGFEWGSESEARWDRVCEEDDGFALSNWSEILFDNSNIIINEDIGIAMGNYTFKNETSNIKVEYSFVYKKYGDEIKVILHHSSLPYKIWIFQE